jgi:hypothetical protein
MRTKANRLEELFLRLVERNSVEHYEPEEGVA